MATTNEDTIIISANSSNLTDEEIKNLLDPLIENAQVGKAKAPLPLKLNIGSIEKLRLQPEDKISWTRGGDTVSWTRG